MLLSVVFGCFRMLTELFQVVAVVQVVLCCSRLFETLMDWRCLFFSLICSASLKLSRLFFSCFNLFSFVLFFVILVCQVVPGCDGSLMDVTPFSIVLGCCRCFKMFRLIFEGFRWFEIAVNNTHLSQWATWRCSRRTSSFFSFCSLPSRMLSVISAGWIWGGCVTGVTQPLHLPSHDFRASCASIWCTSRLHCPFKCVINNKCQTFWYVSVCFKLFRLFFLFLLLVFTFCCWFSCVKLFQCFWLVGWSVTAFFMVVVCFQNVYELALEGLWWSGVASACCGMLQFVWRGF